MEKKKFRVPPLGCMLLSMVLILAGCAALYFNLFQGQHGLYSSREAFIEGVFIFLGCLVFYRGMQGKEYRFWHKDWKSLDEEKAEKK
ncbi:MAG: hypothetical protein ACI4AO_02590 [Anaerotignum sp.]